MVRLDTINDDCLRLIFKACTSAERRSLSGVCKRFSDFYLPHRLRFTATPACRDYYLSIEQASESEPILKHLDKVNSKPLNKKIVEATYENDKVYTFLK